VNDELLDVVNERDEVVNQRPRHEVHRTGLRHRAVHVLLFNAQGQLFLQKRSMQKDCFPGAWDSSAAGHLDAGEDYDRCAVRELREELGLEIQTPLERLFKVEACNATGQEFVWVYQAKTEGPFQLHPEEIECGAWFAVETLHDWLRDRPQDFASGFAEIWRRYHQLPPCS
jgi:isopentenyl-diphosphate delta-isomerase type 1